MSRKIMHGGAAVRLMLAPRGTRATRSARGSESGSKNVFGWLKTIALMRKLRHRGVCLVDWMFTFACAAYNLVRMRNLTAAVPAL